MSNLYAILGVDPKASADEIARAHKKLVFEHHPDKAKKNGDTKTNDMLFTQISNAYHVLSDPIQRAQYDLQAGHTVSTAEERQRINRLKRAEAESQLRLMEETVDALRAQQHAKNGLLIERAHYGDLTDQLDADDDTLAHVGRSIDVTVPLQMLVDVQSSQLVIHSGASKAGLDGFYDPLDDADPKLNPRRLYVRYLYLNRVHEVTVDDKQPLVLPLLEHKRAGEDDATAAAPAASAYAAPSAATATATAPNANPNVSNQTISVQIQAAHALAATKRRRRWIAAGALTLFAGAIVLYATDRLPAWPASLTFSSPSAAAATAAAATAAVATAPSK